MKVYLRVTSEKHGPTHSTLRKRKATFEVKPDLSDQTSGKNLSSVISKEKDLTSEVSQKMKLLLPSGQQAVRMTQYNESKKQF